MEKLITIAIKGDWKPKEEIAGRSYMESTALTLLDPLFFQALGKECGWQEDTRFSEYYTTDRSMSEVITIHGEWKDYALRTHEINFTESLDSAIAYLLSICEGNK